MRAELLINEILTVLGLPVNEQLIGKRWYLFFSDRLENISQDLISSSRRTSKKFSPESSSYIVIYSESYYVNYKTNLARFSAAGNGNQQYVYGFDRPLNIFVPDENHIKKLIDAGALTPEDIKQTFGWKSKNFSDEELPKRVANVVKFGQYSADASLRATGANWEKARALYDGFR